MAPLESQLTADEKQRNSQNFAYEMTYDGTIKSPYPSPIPALPAIVPCPVAAIPAPWPHCKAGREHKAICAGVDFNVYRLGFPTFYHLPHQHRLEVAGVTVFERPSERPSLIVAVNSLFASLLRNIVVHRLFGSEKYDVKSVARKLLGKTCYVNWPRLVWQ